MSNIINNDPIFFPLNKQIKVNFTTHQPVVVKDLKAVDIQHTNDCVFPMKHWVVVFHRNDTVDAANNPAKKPLVEGLKRGRKEESVGLTEQDVKIM